MKKKTTTTTITSLKKIMYHFYVLKINVGSYLIQALKSSSISTMLLMFVFQL